MKKSAGKLKLLVAAGWTLYDVLTVTVCTLVRYTLIDHPGLKLEQIAGRHPLFI